MSLMTPQSETKTRIELDDLVTLTPIAPTAEGIYAPSKLRQPKVISYREFLSIFADHPRVIMVSFEADGYSNPQPVTAYGRGMDAWYILAGGDR